MNYAPITSSKLGQHDSVMAGLSPSNRAPAARTSSATDLPVKYTPVTGRISQAKKGIPAHTCEICKPVKTFTRVEHLRRHQLSHLKPPYPCTFEDCERAFHRPDLLARHLHRHETQGEKGYKSGDPRSRASSAELELGEGRSLKSCSLPSSESSMTCSSFSAITSNFQAVNFPPGAPNPRKRSASQAQLPESEYDGTISSSGASSSMLTDNFKQITFPANDVSGNLGYFSSPSQPGFGDFYIESAEASPQLPLLRIPEETYFPALSYTQDNSPWCSSASDSTYSNHSSNHSDWPRRLRDWGHRSASIATLSDWSSTQSSPYIAKNEPQELSCPSTGPIFIQEDAFYMPSYTSANNVDMQECMQDRFASAFDPLPLDHALAMQTQASGLLGAKRQELLDLQQLARPRLARSRARLAQAYSESPLRIEVPNPIGVQPENKLHCDPEIIPEASTKTMKVQNLVSDSLEFRCLVASCPSPNPRFLSPKAQIGHYELYHSALLLRCEFEDCNGHAGALIEESDREKHNNSHHLRALIERPERARTPRPGYECKERSSENETSCTDGPVGQQKGQHVFQKCEMKEVLKIKIEESSDYEGCKIRGVLPCNPSPTTEGKSIGHPSPASSRSTWRDPSTGFETDSTCSDGESDCGEDDTPWDDPDAIPMVCKQLQVSSAERSGRVLDPIINPLKESLVDRIMGDFWSIFNHEWSKNVRKRTGSPSTPSSSVSDPKSKTSAERSNKKHKRTSDDNEDRRQDEDENEGPKRPRCTSTPPEVGEDFRQKFSCPYRKHNPRKYTHCDRVWRTCALAPFSTVARVKGHLYRNHRIFQCRRCNELFKDDDALQNHFMTVNPCSLQEPAPAEGITAILEKQLRSKKRVSSTQSQEERWQEIYRTLFPMEIVPSAFFEPVQDEAIHSPGSFELANYEEFSRQELPRVFRGALEVVINTAAQPFEEQLRSQLVSMIQECQDSVFSSYRTRNSSGPVASTIAQPPSFSAPILTSSITPDAVNLSSLLEERPIEVLDNLYQRPPYQSQSLSNPEFQLRGRQASETTTRNEPSESGYVSDFSAMHASSSMSQGTRTDLTSDFASNLSGIQPQSHRTDDRGDTENDNTQPFTAFTDDSTTEAQLISFQEEMNGTLFPPPEDFSDCYLYNNQSWDALFPGNG